MILLVDAGNTRIKWAVLENGVLHSGGAILRRGGADGVDLLSTPWAALTPPRRLLIANVAGAEFAASFGAWTQRAWGLDAEFVSAQAKGFGVTNGYTEPQRLGVDRWLALVAARRFVKGPVCVVDCGTALTIDVMEKNGEHLGGLIVPGLVLMRRALFDKTADIGPAMGNSPSRDIPQLAQDTRGGVMGGTLYAAASLIERVVRDADESVGGGMTCILTGGDAVTIRPLLSADFRFEPELVLQGLAIVAEAGP
ncbi:MAG: type III pantothenate kinase [Gammaproteobacteria bacterium]|nr:type III pantothenate kinase [Gammaproteobacteria bacterium]